MVDSTTAHQMFLIFELVVEARSDCVEYAYRLANNFWTYAVTGQKSYFGLHEKFRLQSRKLGESIDIAELNDGCMYRVPIDRQN